MKVTRVRELKICVAAAAIAVITVMFSDRPALAAREADKEQLLANVAGTWLGESITYDPGASSGCGRDLNEYRLTLEQSGSDVSGEVYWKILESYFPPDVGMEQTVALTSGSVSGNTFTFTYGPPQLGLVVTATFTGTTMTGTIAYAGSSSCDPNTFELVRQEGIWETKAPMTTARFGSAAGVIDDKLYVAAGCCLFNGFPHPRFTNLEVYDPDTDTWSTRAPIPTGVYGAAVGVIDGKLYVAGGQASQIEGNNIATLQVYDPATNTWTIKAPMPFGSSQIAAGVIDGKLYAAGGVDPSNTSAVDTLRVYDAATNTWVTKASMPTARASAGAGVVNGILYVVGGSASGLGGAVATVEAYDPATDTWTTMASSPTPRYLHGVGVVDGILYAGGGFDGSPVSTVEAYDPAIDTWTTIPSMPTARILPSVGGVNGILYVAGGTTDGINHLNVLEAFTPRDTTPPDIIAISVSPDVLWPPNHTMLSVTVTPTVSDDVSAIVTCAISNITSNEPVSGIDGSDRAPDWQDTVGLTTSLRAERDPRRSGRVYTLTVTCTDEAGNAATRSVGVAVPLKRGR